jgi:hypothetical protein
MSSEVLVGYSPNDFFYADAEAQGTMPSVDECKTIYNPDDPSKKWDKVCNDDNFENSTSASADGWITKDKNLIYTNDPVDDILIGALVTTSSGKNSIPNGTVVQSINGNRYQKVITISNKALASDGNSNEPTTFAFTSNNANNCISKELCRNKKNVNKLIAIENGHSGADEKYYNTKEQYNELFMSTMNLGIGCLFLGVAIYLNR